MLVYNRIIEVAEQNNIVLKPGIHTCDLRGPESPFLHKPLPLRWNSKVDAQPGDNGNPRAKRAYNLWQNKQMPAEQIRTEMKWDKKKLALSTVM